MRCDTPIFFQSIQPGEYDASSGNYGAITVTETKKWASVTSSGTETLNLIYGELRQDSLTVRLPVHYIAAFDRIRIGTKVYRVDFSRMLRTKHVFVISEVQ